MHLLSSLGALDAKIGIYELWQLPLTLVMLLTAVLITKYPIALFAKFESFVGRIADRPYLSAALVAGLAAGARLALAPFIGTPQPIIPDEVSFLLQAETYLGGHLASHVKLLPDFEQTDVILSPTFASMYPVLRSFPLFVGLGLGIGPWGGVFLSMVALIVAVYWMVREWINSRYGVIAALIVTLRYGVFSFWANSYWDGAFTALGGVLLVGGFRAVRSRPNLLNGALVGLGVVILMTTRPYEGMFFAAPLGAALVVQFVRSTASERKLLIPAGLMTAALIAGGFVLTFAENQAVSGDWNVPPFVLYRETGPEVPALLVQSRDPPFGAPARYAKAQTTLDGELKSYGRRKTWAGILSAETYRFRNDWNFYLGFALVIPFAVGVYALRAEPALLLAAASLGFANSLETWDFSNYATPGFGFVIVAIMAGFQSLRRWRPWGYPYGLSLSRVLPLALVLGSAIPLSAALTGWPLFILQVNIHPSTACCWLRPRSLHMNVADVIDHFEGRNLIIVDSNAPKAPKQTIVVSNDPDVDNEKTVWINEDPEFDQLAIDRYPGRRIWRLAWLDDGAACLQTSEAVSSLLGALPEDGRSLGYQKWGWSPGSPDRCPGGFVHAPFVELE